MNRAFINPTIQSAGIDRIVIRTTIFRSIEETLHLFKGKLLDVGCGIRAYEKFLLTNSEITDYVGLDIKEGSEKYGGVKPDFYWDGQIAPFQDNTFDIALCMEVLEHCPNPGIVISEARRVLKKEGIFFFTIPFLWPFHEVPYDEFRYTPFAMKRLLKEAGFEKIIIQAQGGWQASLAQILGLWVVRAPLSKRRKKLLYFLIKPLVKLLMRIDTPPREFKEGQMINGLYGYAIK